MHTITYYVRPTVRTVRPILKPLLPDAEFHQADDCVTAAGTWTLGRLKKAFKEWQFVKDKNAFVKDNIHVQLHGLDAHPSKNAFRTFTCEVFRVVNK